MDITGVDLVDTEKAKPSWTVQEYDTQTVRGNLADYLKVSCLLKINKTKYMKPLSLVSLVFKGG